MEVCVEYVESALNAEAGGGVRLELCSALSEGGLTPSVGLLRQVKQRVNLPVCVMIRPRTGNDFVYSSDELQVMETDVQVLGENGADGFVFGVLRENGGIDREACSRLLDRAGAKPCTFHRAFDMTPDPVSALNDIISLGFKRLLTSGQEPNALKGSELIAKLIKASSGRLTVMPGCGVNPNNLREILEITGADEFHGTGSSPVVKTLRNADVALGHTQDESTLYVTDVHKIRSMTSIYKQFRLCSNK